jgi:hypothetical protein
VSRLESLASEASTRDLSSAIAAFFDGVAPATAGVAAPPPPAEFDASVGGAVVGDLGWTLGPDLDTAVAIAADPDAGIWRMRRGFGPGGSGRGQSDSGGCGRQFGAFGSGFEEDLV